MIFISSKAWWPTPVLAVCRGAGSAFHGYVVDKRYGINGMHNLSLMKTPSVLPRLISPPESVSYRQYLSFRKSFLKTSTE